MHNRHTHILGLTGRIPLVSVRADAFGLINEKRARAGTRKPPRLLEEAHADPGGR